MGIVPSSMKTFKISQIIDRHIFLGASYSEFPVKAKMSEFIILALFIFCLPSLEAPKNILYVSYILIWIFNRVKYQKITISWGAWDTLFGIWLLSGFFIAAISNQGINEWNGAFDLVRYISIGWLVYRANYSPQTLTLLLSLVVASTLIGAFYSFYLLDGSHFNLYSVGHINHGAIYYSISTGVVLSLATIFWSKFNFFQRAILATIVLAFFYFTFQTQSRGAILPLLFIFCPLFFLSISFMYKKILVYFFLSILVLVGVSISLDLPMVSKIEKIYQDGSINFSSRERSINSGLLIWKNYPIAGVGLENIDRFMTKDSLKSMAENFGLTFSEQKYYVGSHAHNIYANTLGERGILGFIPLIVILVFWLYLMVKERPSAEKTMHEIAAWGAALSAWTAVSIGGLFNTTLHHEHGSLAVLLLGIWLASKRLTTKH